MTRILTSCVYFWVFPVYDPIRALHGEQLLDQPLERPPPSRALAGLGIVILVARILIASNHNKIAITILIPVRKLAALFFIEV